MNKTKDPNGNVTNKALGEAVDAILKGMDNLLKEERKFNVQTFASKEDLNREIGWVRDDINGLKADLSDTVSRKEFNNLKVRFDSPLEASV